MKKNEDVTATFSPGDYADTIAGVWAAVLGRETCERQTNFFDLGGSSLTMMRAHVELQRRLGFDVSIVELFAHPTIDALAGRLAVLRATNDGRRPGPTAPSVSGPLTRMFRPMPRPT